MAIQNTDLDTCQNGQDDSDQEKIIKTSFQKL